MIIAKFEFLNDGTKTGAIRLIGLGAPAGCSDCSKLHLMLNLYAGMRDECKLVMGDWVNDNRSWNGSPSLLF